MDVSLRILIGLLVGLALTGCQTPTAGGQNVALLYGVTDYGLPGGAKNLLYPRADVEALAPLLSAQSGGIYQVTARTDAAATRAAIEQDIRDAAATMDANSVFLFYFGGHGVQGLAGSLGGNDGHAYILPRGSLSTTSIIAANTITEEDLRQLLATLPTKKIIVILDACFSGGFIADAGADGVPADSAAYYAALWKAFLAGKAPWAGQSLADWLSSVAGDAHLTALASWNKALAAGSGFAADEAQVLTAAGALEESYDAPSFGHGAFTYFLLQAKSGGDADGNGLVTVSEAYRVAFKGIQTQWNGVWGAVGQSGFATSTSTFLPHLSSGPADYGLFRK